MEGLFQSEKFLNYCQDITIIGLMISIPICLGIAVQIYRMGKKYDARRKEIEKEINAPGMEDVRWLLKEKLKEHGIKSDDDAHNRN